MKTCIDCGAAITKLSKRCRSCRTTEQWRTTGIPRGTQRSRKESTVRRLSATEAAWVGALIEGEGCMTPRSPDVKEQPQINVASTEVETISTLLRLVGEGCVMYKAYRQPNYKDSWIWELRRRRSVVRLLRQIWPWMTGKQDRALAMVACYGEP